MTRRSPRVSLSLAAILPLALLAACNNSADRDEPEETDPALTGALGEQIMVDPDLAGSNETGAAISDNPLGGALPNIDRSPEAIASARKDAMRMVGGEAKLRQAPTASAAAPGSSGAAAIAAAAKAATSPVAGVDCAGQAEYSARWAARLPASLPIYPRGNVTEAAGSDANGCALRVVNFVTPVPLDDVINFYYSRAKDGGYSANRGRQDGDDVLSGTKGAAAYVIYARKVAAGGTSVDLVVSGG